MSLMRILKDDITITAQGPPFAGGEDINNVSPKPVFIEFEMAQSQGETEPAGGSLRHRSMEWNSKSKITCFPF